MPRITFVEPDGTAQTFDAAPGLTVMECGVNNDVAGILAECGGSSACATCQVYIDDAWNAKLAAPSDLETSMVDRPPLPGRTVRLSCQIEITDALDGLVVAVPASQH